MRLGFTLDLRVRRRLRGELGRDLGGDPRVVDELADRPRVADTTPADSKTASAASASDADARPYPDMSPP